MLSKPQIFKTREMDANQRISDLRQSLSKQLDDLPESNEHPTLTIYATGSLARKEATAHSDLDAFFLLSGKEDEKPLGRIRDVKILNAVLQAQESAGFPDFSNDGAYLKFLHIEDIIRCIGSRDDDYKNAFTARILLLTESTFLYNEENFNKFRDDIISVYFQDFHNHSTDFRPIFLLNDILRFWRTLCLNYENARHWRNEEDGVSRAKGHLDNLKLKFSRLNICYSFITHLLSQGSALTKDNVLRTSSLTPIDRLIEISDDKQNSAIVDEIFKEYSWFLEITDKSRDDALGWISNQSNRDLAFAHAAKHVQLTGELVRRVAENNGYLRYLVI